MLMLLTQHPHRGSHLVAANWAEARTQAAFGDTEACTDLLAYWASYTGDVSFLYHPWVSLTTTVCFWLLGSGQGQKWPLTVKSNRFCRPHFSCLSFALGAEAQSRCPYLENAISHSPCAWALLVLVVFWTSLAAPTPWVGVKILTLWSWKLPLH